MVLFRIGSDGSGAPAKAAALSPFEAHWLRLARDFTQHRGEAPLFPALEAAALWNGFQQMSRSDLEAHAATIAATLRGGEVPWGNKKRAKPHAAADGQGAAASAQGNLSVEAPAAASGNATGAVKDLMTGDLQNEADVTGASLSEAATSAAPAETGDSAPPVLAPAPGGSEPSGDQEYGHSWSVESEMLCKFLLGCCHKHLGETEKASDELAFAISVGQNIGG